MITEEIWKAAPSTSNGNEQAHRSIISDGVKLSLVAGLMRGMEYDSRALAGIEVTEIHGIHLRDQLSTHFRRATRAIVRSGIISSSLLVHLAGTVPSRCTATNYSARRYQID
jgi:hypothetical protein